MFFSKKNGFIIGVSISSFLLFSFFRGIRRPVLYIIGDSTVKNSKGSGDTKLWGWGSLLPNYFDTSHILLENDAIPGRSSRTFWNEGKWDEVRNKLQKGDFLLIQFGHNDGGPLADSSKFRGSIRGIVTDSVLIFNKLLQKEEYVHSYGWYLTRMVREAKQRGAQPIICSPIPRHIFANGFVVRADKDFGYWASLVARQTDAGFIDLNKTIADQYDRLGADSTALYFPADQTHTNLAGATVNASAVIAGIRLLAANKEPGGSLASFITR